MKNKIVYNIKHGSLQAKVTAYNRKIWKVTRYWWGDFKYIHAYVIYIPIVVQKIAYNNIPGLGE